MDSAHGYRNVPKCRSSQARQSGDSRRGVSWTLRLVDVGIASAIVVVPFFMGGRTPAGQLVFTAVAFWTALWWSVHQACGYGDRKWRSTLAFAPMLLGVAVVVIQGVLLSPNLIQTLSPHLYDALPLWCPATEGTTTLGTWHTLSFTPETTRQSLFLLISGVLLFAVVVQRIERTGDVERILRWVAVSVSLMAAFGIIQFLTSNGKFFWFYEHPYSTTSDCVKGAFTNRNHFAQFVALGFGALLWWVYGDEEERLGRSSSRTSFGSKNSNVSLRTALKTLLVPLCSLAVLMSFSRGGVLALLVSCITALFLLLHAGRLRRRTFAVLAGSGLAVCLGLSIYGYDALSNRFESAKSFASLDDRSNLWAAAREGFGDHLVCGTGLTSHSSVHSMYLSPKEGAFNNLVYTHAENGYVQMALETGGLGIAFALTALGLFFFYCAASLSNEGDLRNHLCFVAILPALLANTVHSACDFVWYVPGCMVIVVILGACACRLYQLARRSEVNESRPWRLPRFAWAGVAIALAAASWLVVPTFWKAYRAEGPWNRYLALRQSLVKLNRRTAYDEVHAASESRREILDAEVRELTRVLELRPNWGYAHACKADVHRDLFHEYQSTAENEFDLRMIRETVRDNFESAAEAREWLPRAIGDHIVHLDAALKHAHRAVALEPLQGEVYITLAQLSFLETSSCPGQSAYIDQAYRVRPHHGTVLFEIGNELTLAGHPGQALKYLKRSFSCGPEHQKRLIQTLAGNVPVGLFLREFQPDSDALQVMASHYERPELEQELEHVLVAHAAACVAKARSLEGSEAAYYWYRAASSYGKLNDPLRRRDCMESAVSADTTNFDMRLGLGQSCLAIGDFAEAEKQLRWCDQRKPGHPRVQRFLREAVGGRIESDSHAGLTTRPSLPQANRVR